MSNYSIISHPTESRLLVVSGSDGWTLPSHAGREAPDIIADIRDQFGIEVTVLRTVAQGVDYALYALDNHSPDWAPPQAMAWFGPHELDQIANKEHRSILKRWFDTVPVQDWARPGWYDEAVAWIRRYTDAPIEQFRVRPTGNVMRVGDWYFKAVMHGLNEHEPALTQFLAEHFPDNIPTVEAVHLERGWFLQHDAGIAIREFNDLDQWAAAIRHYARLQQQADVEAISALGVKDRSLEVLPALYERIVNVPDLWVADAEEDAIPPDKLAEVKTYRPQVERICQQLGTYNIPMALHHDDFSGANILLKDDRINFIDWGESYITHPFCSLFIFLRYAAYVFKLKSDDPALAHLRDAYLLEWRDYGSLSELVDAYKLAADLAKLHRALTWRDFYERLEPSDRVQYVGNAEYWLQVFLGLQE